MERRLVKNYLDEMRPVKMENGFGIGECPLIGVLIEISRFSAGWRSVVDGCRSLMGSVTSVYCWFWTSGGAAVFWYWFLRPLALGRVRTFWRARESAMPGRVIHAIRYVESYPQEYSFGSLTHLRDCGARFCLRLFVCRI